MRDGGKGLVKKNIPVQDLHLLYWRISCYLILFVNLFQGDLRSMWSEPFVTVPPAKYQTI